MLELAACSSRVLVSERERVPLAAWMPGRASVVLPAALLVRPADLRLALRHEAEHHRRGDTRWLYALLLLRAFFGLNPALQWLARQLSELQEYACDEVLGGRKDHCARTYCACLLRIADAAMSGREPLHRSCMACKRPFALAKRIETALNRPANPLRAPAALTIGVAVVVLLTAVSIAIAGPIHDRRISHASAVRLAASVHGPSIVPLTVNRPVLQQLNLLLGTPGGREFLRSGIARMHHYGPAILAALHRHALPVGLLAVPLVESGYRNVASGDHHGVGLWQMIAPTARQYGLEVSGTSDGRLNARAETAAAIRMFVQLHDRFHSWPLAVMAYNAGIAQVKAGIRSTHSRDPWTLYKAGFGNDQDYFARVVAVTLILANPRLLK